ncbi:mechanosensitive ion channel domain-containing protein [Pseudochelatococcus sp. G4_1912]|uniref:mechanosensitive ion channel domain-containing protein n=1 Tax=Pseudochelatococcus sp. G4_1912 TaxID=3114288 RepID=UPI0039C5E9EF
MPSCAVVAATTYPMRRTRIKHAINGGIASFGNCAAMLMLALLLLAGPALAQTGVTSQNTLEATDSARSTTAQPPTVTELLRLLADPQVQQWLQATQASEPAATPAPAPVSALPATPDGLAASLTARLAHVRTHIHSVIDQVPNLPGEIAHARDRFWQDAESSDTNGTMLRVFLSVGLGLLCRFALLRYAKQRAEHEQLLHNTPGQRLQSFGLRVALAVAPSLAFAIGALIPLIAVEWPPLIKHATLSYLLALLAIQLVHDISYAVLVRARAVDRPPHYQESGLFWYRRIVLFFGCFFLSWATVGNLASAQIPHHSEQAIAYLLGLVQLALAFEIIWRRPLAPDASLQRRHLTQNILLSLYGVILWLLWAAGLNGLFWLGVFALLIPTLLMANGNFVRDIIRPDDGIRTSQRGLLEVGLERGIRVLILAAAVLWLAHIWQIDLVEFTNRDTAITRLARGALNAAIVLLLADFIWQIARTTIDIRLAHAAGAGGHDAHGHAPETIGHAVHGDDSVRKARLRTLLPIFRNILLVIIVLIAGLTALSGLGVEIAPLIAGAGVVGVAVGFGSQTIVKDIISGVFYLLDDAFRVGEYIQSGHYKGVVESFSLRSVKLRHQRGPIYTVPFGQLGAVQNMSRDWVYDKFQIGVAYNTDLEQARKIIKNIGTELAANPEFAPHILEPLKMQGVQEFGQYGVEIRCKIKTRPGEQFVLRRTALKRIKQEFDAAGIKFALPSMQVASGTEPGAAAMQVHKAAEAARAAELAEDTSA